jgi:hypothetical protein
MKSFVKREKAVWVAGCYTFKRDPVPRLIQGRSVDVKVATGPFTWAYGKSLCKLYAADTDYVYASGVSAEDLGKVLERHPDQGPNGYNWVAFDCKRWDSTVGPSPTLCLWREYKKCGAPKNCIDTFRDRHKRRFGKTRSGITYSRFAQVSSGDGDTSAGNTRIHLVMLENCGAVKAAIVHGDDSCVYTNDVEAVSHHYRVGGFNPVPSQDFDFCSALFWPTEDGLVLGPKIGRLLAKTFTSTHHFSPSKHLEWLRGVCLGLDVSCSYIPILRALIPRLLHLCGDGKVWCQDSYDYKTRAAARHGLCEETWIFMQHRYDLSEQDVLAMESELQTVELGTLLCGAPWLDLVIRDMG